MSITQQQASASVEWAWPDAVALVVRAANIAVTSSEKHDVQFAQAVVLTLAADDGRLVDEWATSRLLWLAAEVVPGLLADLREARTMAARLDADALAQHLATTTHW